MEYTKYGMESSSNEYLINYEGMWHRNWHFPHHYFNHHDLELQEQTLCLGYIWKAGSLSLA